MYELTLSIAQNFTEQCCTAYGQVRCPYKADYVIKTSVGYHFCFCAKHVKELTLQGKIRQDEHLIPFNIYAEEQRRERSKLIHKETKRVKYHVLMAEKYALPATLTTEQWIKTLDHFWWRCAYCYGRRYTVLEHFIPLIHGGGTTVYNCVPSCASCNSLKSDMHPSMIALDGDFRISLPYVQKYLELQKQVEEV